MKIIVTVFLSLFIVTQCFAMQCIVKSNGDIKEWTSGVFINSNLENEEKVKNFKTIPFNTTKKLIYKDNDIVVTDEDNEYIKEDKKIKSNKNSAKNKLKILGLTQDEVDVIIQ